MAVFHIEFRSEILELQCGLNVILPQKTLKYMKSRKPKYQTLWLLHGLSDDHSAWQRWTSIERYVDNTNLAVVMPAVGRSFYADMVHGLPYWSFLTKELPVVARWFFPLSAERADNFVAGFRWAVMAHSNSRFRIPTVMRPPPAFLALSICQIRLKRTILNG
jgi:putative tributyrin esterase